MERILIILFLILFLGRIILRYILQELNIGNLKLHRADIPAVFQGVIDESTMQKMVDYTVENSRLASQENFLEDAIELAVLFLLVPVLAAKLAGLHIPFIVQGLIFFGCLAVISGVIGIPFSIYHTFVLEKKYGFSTITLQLWLADLAKSIIISVILIGILIAALMAFILYLPSTWWFWGWIFFTLFEILIMWIYPVVIAPLFNKYEPIKDESLRSKIIALMAEAGLKTKGVFQVDEGKRSKHTNAYFTGIGKTKRIVLFDTLLASHSPEEILSILAHEIGHWQKKHILKQLVFTIVASLVVLYIVYRAVHAPQLYLTFGVPPGAIYAGLFLVSVYFGCLGFFLSPIAAGIMRRYEREADEKAVELTGSALPMIGALKRLAKDNLANLHPHPLYVWFYYSHPPLLTRIGRLQEMENRKEKI
jgi:STE24 endopeptidase